VRRKWNRKTKGPGPWPTFFAWCPETERFEAFASALTALVGESGLCTVYDFDAETDSEFIVHPAKAVEVIRATYEKYGWQRAEIEFKARSGREITPCVQVHLDRRCYPRQHDQADSALSIAFWAKGFEEGMLLPPELTRLKRKRPSMKMDAGVAWQIAIWDAYDILVRFCTASLAITTGGCGEGWEWGAPITNAGTYHADGYPGRDLALSWMYLYENEPIDLPAGWPLDALRERVEASPPGSSVWIIDEERLAREQVLAALDLPPKVLVEALEAAAAERHPEWETVEWELFRLLGEIQNEIKNAPDNVEMIPVTEEHIRFIEEHTPAYVKRLESGAIVLIAHPDRTLWPLWADALALLGIRPKGSG
jgi:hypothetical protein